jgi:hypothetical protein
MSRPSGAEAAELSARRIKIGMPLTGPICSARSPLVWFPGTRSQAALVL